MFSRMLSVSVFLIGVLLLPCQFALAQDLRHFAYERTDGNMSILIEGATINDESLVEGDEIGLFTEDGLCAGAGIVPDGFPDRIMGVAGWGSEDQMDNGFQHNEPLAFRLWDGEADLEYHADAEEIVGRAIYALNAIVRVSLSAEGEPIQEPEIAVNDPEHDFGDVLIDQSAEWTLVITNTGGALLEIDSVETTGDYFTDDADEGFSLEVDESRDIIVTFSPSEEGEFEGLVTIVSNDPGNGEFLVLLAGSGVVQAVAEIVVDPAELDFGDVTVGETGDMVLTISNQGDEALTVQAILVDNEAFAADFENEGGPHFQWERTDASHSLLINEAILDDTPLQISDEIGVFTPNDLCAGSVIIAEPGEQVGLAAWGDDAFTEDVIEGFQVGEEFSFRFWDASAWQEIEAEPDYINGSHAWAVNGITRLTLSAGGGMNPDDIAEAVIEPGESIEVGVHFSPDQEGEYEGVLTIISDDPDDPEIEVPMSGTGVQQQPDIAVSNNLHDFGQVVIEESEEWIFTVTNEGGADLEIESVTTAGDYFSDDTDEGFVLEPDASRDVTVTFSPAEAGEFVGTVTIASDDPDEAEVVIELSGTGVVDEYPEIAIDPESLEFGEVLIDETGDLVLTISNVGEADLSVNAIRSDNDAFTVDFENQEGPHFQCRRTDSNHSLMVTEATLNDEPLQVDDEIGVFTPDDLCAGAAIVVEPGEQIGLAAWGDEALTEDIIEGFQVGEEFTFLFWDVSAGREVEAVAGWISGSRVWAVNGLSRLTLSASYDRMAPADLAVEVIAPGESIEVAVHFTPDEAGEYEGVLTVVSDDPNNPNVEIPATGIGIEPAPDFHITWDEELGYPDVIDFNSGMFPDMFPGQPYSVEVLVSNMGQAAGYIESITVNNEFFTIDPVEFEVAPEEQVPFEVTLETPNDFSGEIEAVLTILAADPYFERWEIDMIAEVVGPPRLELQIDDIVFGEVPVGGTATRDITVTNTGDAPLRFAVEIQGIEGDAFTTDIEGGEVPGGESLDFTVVFAPEETGDFVSELHLTSNDPNAPQLVINLSGSGVEAAPNLGIDPEELNFGDLFVGEERLLTLTISNSGNSPLEIESIESDNDVFSTNFEMGGPHFIYRNTDVSHLLLIMEALIDGDPLAVDDEVGVFTEVGLCAGASIVEEEDEMIGVAAWGDEAFTEDVIEGFMHGEPFAFRFWDRSAWREFDAVPEYLEGPETYQFNGFTRLNLSVGEQMEPMDIAQVEIPAGEEINVRVYFAPDEAGDFEGTLTITSNDPDDPETEISMTGTGLPQAPRIFISDAVLDFGAVLIETSAEASLTVTNTGMQDLTIDTVYVESDVFSVDVEGEIVLQPDESAEIVVTFTPPEAADYEGVLVIVSDDPENAQLNIPLIGRGRLPQPRIFIDAFEFHNEMPHDFGEVLLEQSRTWELEIGNHGEALLEIQAEIEGDGFAVSPENVIEVEVDDFAVITVTFTPDEPGEYNGILHILSNDVGNDDITFDLVGMGVEQMHPDISLDQDALDFGRVVIENVADLQLTGMNLGNAPLTIERIEIEGEGFSTDFDNDEGMMVDVEARFSITISFEPGQVADYEGTLTLTCDDPDEAELTVDLAGRGVVSLYHFQFIRTGESMSIIVDEATIDGEMLGEGGEVAVFTPGGVCGGSEIVSDEWPIGVTAWADDVYSEEVDGFEQNEVIHWRLWDADANQEWTAFADYSSGRGIFQINAFAEVSLSARTEESPRIRVSELAHDFGRVLIDERAGWSFEIHNLGDAVLVIDSIYTDAEIFIVDDIGEDVEVDIDGSIEVGVTFAPVEAGQFAGLITVLSNDPEAGEIEIELTGVGIEPAPPQIHLSAAEHDFGEVALDHRAEWVLTVSNTGGGDLQIENLTIEGAGFSVDPEDGFVLGIDGSRDVAVTFIPDEISEFEGALEIRSNDLDNEVVEVPLSGTGVRPDYHWDFVETDNNMSLIIDEVVVEDDLMAFDTQVGVFTPEDQCAGVSVINDYPFGLAAWGDDAITEDVVEGFVDGEALNFRIWDPVAEYEMETEAEYTEGEGVYAVGGLARLNIEGFLPEGVPHFRGVIPTNLVHSLLVSEAALYEQPLEIGDEVGVFTENGVLAGAVILEEPGNVQFDLIAYGNDPETEVIEGFENGEEFDFRYWDADAREEIQAIPEWLEGQRVFGINAFSVLNLTEFRVPGPNIIVPATYDFGPVSIEESATWEMSIQNTGEELLVIDEIEGPEAPFSLQIELPLEIDANSQAVVEVEFAPAEAGDFAGSIIIRSNDPDNDAATVELSGIGFIPNFLPEWVDIPEPIEGRENSLIEFTVVGTDRNEEDALTIAFESDNLPEEGPVFVDHEDGTGTFTWTPTFDEAGDYSAVFTLSDGEFQVAAEVLFDIANLNRLPEIRQAIEDVATNEDRGFLSIADLDMVVRDPDGDELEFEANGVDELGLHLDDNNVLSIDPIENYFGDSEVIITVDDGWVEGGLAMSIRIGQQADHDIRVNRQLRSVRSLEQNPDRIPIRDEEIDMDFNVSVEPINDPPFWVDPPDPFEVGDDELLEFTLTADDFDFLFEGDEDLTLAMTEDEGLIDLGATFEDINDNTGDFSWQIESGDEGEYRPVFTVTDQADESEEITIVITVNPVSPVIVNPEDDPFQVGTEEGTAVVVNFSAHDPDNDDDELTWSIDEADLPDGWVFEDNEDGTAQFTWTPGYGDDGQYTPLFTVSDPDNHTDMVHVEITVVDNPQDPVIVEPTAEDEWDVEVMEDEDMSIEFVAEDIDNADDELVWVIDPDGLPDGWVFADGEDGTATFDWTPTFDDANINPYTPTFTVTDAQGNQDVITVNITVNNNNRAPAFTAPSDEDEFSVAVEEGTELTFRVEAVDPDQDDALFYEFEELDDLPGDPQFTDNGDGSFQFTWTPPVADGHAEPTYDVAFHVRDRQDVNDPEILLDDIAVHITVNDLNQEPGLVAPIDDIVVQEDAAPVVVGDLDDVFVDPDGDVVNFGLANVPPGITAVIDNENVLTLTLDPNFNLPGGADITVTATDEFNLPAAAPDVFNIVVQAVNDAPGAFNLLAPADGSAIDRQENRVDFAWEEAENVDDDLILYNIFVHVALGEIDSTASVDSLDIPAFVIDDLAMFLYSLGIYVEEGDVNVEVTWWVEAFDAEFTVESDERWQLTVPIPVSVDGGEILPLEFSMSPNFPNPFNPSTSIGFTVAFETHARLSVWDIRGRWIADVVNSSLQPGRYHLEWDAGDSPAGLYIFTFEAGGKRFIRKGVLVR